ncbi:transposase [Rufibacter glacialis]|uniref:Transposase n=1 Tax=Rufibacter glacialis TaxID=1259555 RepID=A0A5M8QBI9_9BACT|nr:transposase [Rufibacter glacialis]KAA6433365.1 transposase [Rufibacter glacialis]GGK74938.1 hypothetical protein GCM10011405_23670 [Rufibacter glacialis]
MPDKFQHKYRIASARLQHWDYGWNAAYFITICTKDRQHYFGSILDGEMQLSEIGRLAYTVWAEIPSHFPFVELDSFVVMPNHVHGLLLIQKPEEPPADHSAGPSTPVETRQCLVSTIPGPPILDSPVQEPPTDKTIGQQRFQNQGKHTLSSIIGSYKSAVTRFARSIQPNFAWQARFHDHIIRNAKDHKNIAHYIYHNPQNWADDKFYS